MSSSSVRLLTSSRATAAHALESHRLLRGRCELALEGFHTSMASAEVDVDAALTVQYARTMPLLDDRANLATSSASTLLHLALLCNNKHTAAFRRGALPLTT